MLFNDPDGVLAGALRAASARAPVARSALAARTRAWTYYLLLEPVLKPVVQQHHGLPVARGAGGPRGRQERGHGAAEGVRALVRRGRRRRGRQRWRDVAIRPRGRPYGAQGRRLRPCWGWGPWCWGWGPWCCWTAPRCSWWGTCSCCCTRRGTWSPRGARRTIFMLLARRIRPFMGPECSFLTMKKRPPCKSCSSDREWTHSLV